MMDGTTTAAPATPAAPLPDYIRTAVPNPPSKRAAWYLNTAPTYAGIFLWFAFWDQLPTAGLNLAGLGITILGIVLAAVICHFLFYLVPGLLGMKTGLPLYIVGTSTFGTTGGLIMPGFLMGALQFGWLGVNTYFSSMALAGSNNSVWFYVICVLWGVGAAFVGLKGIQYVAKVATFLPLIPLAVLILALIRFAGSAGQFQPAAAGHEGSMAPLTGLAMMVTLIVGFFATAGAAGVDFGMNSRDARDVNWGGLVGILLAILFTAGVATVVAAGAVGGGKMPSASMKAQLAKDLVEQPAKQKRAPEVVRDELLQQHEKDTFTVTNALKATESSGLYTAIMIGLALASFPGACFSSFIAANSFKTVMPRVNSFASVGVGALVSILLAVTTWAGDLPKVFGIIGASFGPICGAMCVDYFLAGRKWAGPRAGFNPAGWVAWALGFIVGILPTFGVAVPVAPVAAFVVGAVVYFVLAKAGMESPVVPYAPALEQKLA